MGKIRVLDDQLANQIAAGEVVERPSSVVKELVENAVDAGSTEIDITIEEGGLSLIRVTDNGSGIDPEDIETAFQRHATSKISSSSDLFRIASLGFRGEALPSIAAVSRLTTVSSQDTSGLGRKLFIEGGAVTANEPANAPRGTDMSVRDLFYNTPARLKYMKSIQTELGHITDYVNRIALAHPGIAFTLTHNGGTLLRTLGTGDRLQVIAAVYGSSAAKGMLPVEAENADYMLSGFISKPEQTRANRNGMTMIVNGRYIKSFILNQSIVQAYHTLLPINRFPLVVLELGMHPSLLDVNVHPSKMEVRFSKEAELRELVEQAVKAALGRQRYIPGPEAALKRERSGPLYVQDAISFHQPDPASPPARPGADEGASSAAGAKPWEAGRSFGRPEARRGEPFRQAAGEAAQPGQRQAEERPRAFGAAPEAFAPREGRPLAYGRGKPGEPSPHVPRDAAERLYAPPANAGGAPDPAVAMEDGRAYRADAGRPAAEETAAGAEAAGAEAAAAAQTEQPWSAAPSAPFGTAEPFELASPTEPDKPSAPAEPESAESGPAGAFPELSWIGQMHGTYIVAQAEDGLYLIDQHAAHERINYEYYFHKFGNPVAASQQLLIPLTLEFTAGEALQLQDRLELFAEAGVELEAFGAQTFLVRAHPEWFPEGEEKDIIEEMAELVIKERKSIDIAKLREKAAIMCSCKASIKANDRKTREEGEALLARLAACKQPYTCPHGRPIVVHFSNYQLEKMFKRVMS